MVYVILIKVMKQLLYEELTYKIIGISMRVHEELGPGFLEAVYEEAIVVEFQEEGIPFRNQAEVDICYKGKKLEKKYRADFIIDEKVLLEIKGTSGLTEIHEAQMINYLKATGLRVGLLVNFGKSSLEWKRIIY